MSGTVRRITKRSVLGTRIASMNPKGFFKPGIITAIKTFDKCTANNIYSVRLEGENKNYDYFENQIVGPGFEVVSNFQLQPKQPVFFTYGQREVSAVVIRHNKSTGDVLCRIKENENILVKDEDIRLFECRKSARLLNCDTNFSKLASMTNFPVNKTTRSNRLCGGGGGNNNNSDFVGQTQNNFMFKADFVQNSGSRKRRPSESILDEDKEFQDDARDMSDCTAAMVLMKLSGSPHSPLLNSFKWNPDGYGSCSSSTSSESYRSLTPSPHLSSNSLLSSDEGIIKDITPECVIFVCTFPGCSERRSSVYSIECHVRKVHLGRPEHMTSVDHEEEFYYSEVELNGSSLGSVSDARLMDHCNMARPAHEDPKSLMVVVNSVPSSPLDYSQAANRSSPPLLKTLEFSASAPSSPWSPIPVSFSNTTSNNGPSGGKFLLLSPPPSSNKNHQLMESPLIRSPNRRTRDGKKCRKVYGLEQREKWCTQCKWKKACGRFSASGEANNNNVVSSFSSSFNKSAPISPLVFGTRRTAVDSNSSNTARALRFD